MLSYIIVFIVGGFLGMFVTIICTDDEPCPRNPRMPKSKYKRPMPPPEIMAFRPTHCGDETLSPQPHKTIYGYSFSGYSFDDNLDNWKHRHN
jgi:hypothetical protein